MKIYYIMNGYPNPNFGIYSLCALKQQSLKEVSKYIKASYPGYILIKNFKIKEMFSDSDLYNDKLHSCGQDYTWGKNLIIPKKFHKDFNIK
jgi:hypothetical protein